MKYKKGEYYEELGTYIEIRKTYNTNQKMIVEYLFDTGERDVSGAAKLKRIRIDG